LRKLTRLSFLFRFHEESRLFDGDPVLHRNDLKLKLASFTLCLDEFAGFLPGFLQVLTQPATSLVPLVFVEIPVIHNFLLDGFRASTISTARVSALLAFNAESMVRCT